ncbi:hypothetical protein ACN47E_002660 [Coniothyrium glycines]
MAPYLNYLAVLLASVSSAQLGRVGANAVSVPRDLTASPPADEPRVLDFESLGGPPEHPLRDLTSPLDTTAPASDDLWARCLCKGNKFLTQMSYSDYDVGQSLPVPATTAQSPWESADLETWGYYYEPAHIAYRKLDTDGYWATAPYFRKLGISDKCTEEEGLWACNVINHFDQRTYRPIKRQSYTGPDGRIRRMTGAYAHMAVSPEGGVMMQNRLSPAESAEKEYGPGGFPTDELPALQRSSDLLWAMWEEEIPENKRQNIQFFMSLSITNDITLKIMKRAMGDEDISSSGKKFMMTSEAGKALLGTPNAAAFAHFLIQRKLQVGLKHITEVYALHCDTGAGSACLLYVVRKLAAPVPRPLPEPKRDPKTPSQLDPNTPLEGIQIARSVTHRIMNESLVALDHGHDFIRVHHMTSV